jgi:hypothetical protein
MMMKNRDLDSFERTIEIYEALLELVDLLKVGG